MKENFSINKSIEILERTPIVLKQLLDGLSPDWISCNEGAETWSPYDVIGHLIHAEKTDWIPRAEQILGAGADKTFKAFDRFAQFEDSRGKLLGELLEEFTEIRMYNIEKLLSFNIAETDFAKTAIHPAFGEVTLRQLLSTWVVHDLDHLSQTARVMAKQYADEVGPWTAYLKILRQS